MRNRIVQGCTEGFNYVHSILLLKKSESDNCRLRFAYFGCRVQKQISLYFNIFQTFEIFLHTEIFLVYRAQRFCLMVMKF